MSVSTLEPRDQFGAFTLDEFAEHARISRPQLFKLLKAGVGPRTYKVGRRRYVSLRAAFEWQAALER